MIIWSLSYGDISRLLRSDCNRISKDGTKFFLKAGIRFEEFVCLLPSVLVGYPWMLQIVLDIPLGPLKSCSSHIRTCEEDLIDVCCELLSVEPIV